MRRKRLRFSTLKPSWSCKLGLGCGYLPRYLAQRFIDSGALVEKQVLAQSSNESVWVGWNEQTAGLGERLVAGRNFSK
jgi:DNA-binding transcriptional LysR family regulator